MQGAATDALTSSQFGAFNVYDTAYYPSQRYGMGSTIDGASGVMYIHGMLSRMLFRQTLWMSTCTRGVRGSEWWGRSLVNLFSYSLQLQYYRNGSLQGLPHWLQLLGPLTGDC